MNISELKGIEFCGCFRITCELKQGLAETAAQIELLRDRAVCSCAADYSSSGCKYGSLPSLVQRYISRAFHRAACRAGCKLGCAECVAQ